MIRYQRLAVIVLFLVAPATPAQTFTWDGGLSHSNFTVNNFWSTPNNWVGGAAPASGINTDLVFTQSGIRTTADQNISNPFLLHSLTFDANNTNFTSIADLPLNFSNNSAASGPAVTQNSGTPVTISNALTLTNTLTVGGAGAGILTLAGTISGPGNLTKVGTSTLNLTGSGSSIPALSANAGTTTITGGTLSATSDNFPLNVGTGSTVGSLTISGGAVVNVPSTNTNAGVTINGQAGTTMTVSGAGSTLMSGSYIAVAYGGSGNLTVQNGANITETTQSLEVGSFAGDNGTVLIQSGGMVTASNVICGVYTGATGSITVTGSGSNLSVSGLTLLSFTHGSGNLLIANGGSATLTGGIQFGNDPTSVTVNGGTLSTPRLNITATTLPTVLLSDPANGYALTIGTSNTTSTYSGPIADAAGGPGTLKKVGTGTLTLTGILTNTGGYAATAGTIEFSGAVVQPGPGSLTAFAGATILYDNSARVFGGFLRGTATHVVTGGSTFTGTTSFNSTVINVTGSGSFVNFSNGGTMTVSAGSVNPAFFNGLVNQGSGTITVGAASAVDAVDFQSYGLINLTPGPSPSAVTLMTNFGTSPMYFNGGSRTFIGTAGGNGQARLELNGQNAIVAGGLFVNNGKVTDSSALGISTVIADYGALVKGAGQYDNSPVTQNGGKFQSGNSPGVATMGRFVFGPGGVSNYVFAIDDATGQAGPTPDAAGHVSGWGLVKAAQWQRAAGPTSGDFAWTADAAHPLTVAIDTLVNPTTVGTDVPGLMADFDPSRSYSWPAVQWSGTYSGPTDVASLDAATNFDTSGFANPITGTFGWSLSVAQALSLSYTPSAVPEPGTLALVGLAAVGLAWRRKIGPVTKSNL